ncbi:MAG TPA: hydantoinase/oxoprolinase family protein [Gaiellaceae bacterium]|nr:hydantoinase/oxoprolinase family protein [Gaiellaceae bacterium]
MSVRIGIDTGGTFTDLVLIDDDDGALRTAKVPSTPDDPARAVGDGLRVLLNGGTADRLVVGTTIATNAVIERRGPEIVYIGNRGFEDVPFIGRLDKEQLYDLNWQKPKPLVARRNCVGVGGRIDHSGDVIAEVDEDDLSLLRQKLADADPGSTVVAVCLLFSYLRPEHERRIRELVQEALPGVEVSVSHEVSPVWREYERASTTIADAFVKPSVASYVERVGRAAREQLSLERWNLLGSNGGYVSAEEAQRRPAQLLLSGLAGGVIGGKYFAEAAGYPSLFTLDMGGTSCDLGLILDGEQRYANEFDVSWGIPVTIPCVAVQTIGAGGGSIIWVDKGGLLHVGPQSAGAQPGPAAYGHGASEPTLTDANLVLGRLDPDFFLGGAMKLDLEAARKAVGDVADALGMEVEAAALAAVRTADENMANAIRLIAVERGLDPREFALIAFGGAGAVHARAVAERLGIGTCLIPPHPGLCSAFGSAITDARVDRARTVYARSDELDLPLLADADRRLRQGVEDELRQTVDAEPGRVVRTADMRYVGQNYELEIPLPDGDLDAASWAELLERFEQEHRRLYGFALAGEPVELINLRVTASCPEPRLGWRSGERRQPEERTRPIWFGADGPVETPIVHRSALADGTSYAGPMVIQEDDSTTVVFPGDQVTVGEADVLVLTIGEGG